tara:strand:+ start:2114 stop:2785 length:672 start_codon:yes stop_codon:yes gene_type:complete
MYYTNKIDTILFDMDGTVLASEDIFGISEQRLLESYGINVELDALIEFRGLSIEAFYPQFIAKFNLNDSIKVVQNKLQAILYKSFSEDLEYIPGFINFYNDIIISYDIKTALVTNTSLELVNHIRKSINLDHFFSLYITASDVSCPKPSGIPYIQAIKELQSTSDSTIVIEDSGSGIRSGLEAGCEVIALTTTLLTNQIQEISDRITICDNYGEIKNCLHGRV